MIKWVDRGQGGAFRRCTAVMLALAGMWLATASVAASAPVRRTPIDPPQGEFADDWYAVTVLGKKAGHMHTVQRREGDVIVTRVDTVLSLVRERATVTIETTDLSRERIDGTPLSFESRLKTGRNVVRYAGTIDGASVQLTAEQLENRLERAFTFEHVPVLAWGEFVAQTRHGLEPGTAYTIHVYNPGLRIDAPIPLSVQVGKPEVVDLFGRKVEAATLQQSMLGMDTTIWVADDGTRLRLRTAVMNLPIEMTRCSKAYALADVEPPEMFVSSLIPTKTRMDRRAAQRITYQLHLPESPDALRDLPETGMQRILKREEASVTVEVARQDHAALARADVVTPGAEYQHYLAPSLFLNFEDPKVRAMADEAAADELHPYRLADRLRRYVQQHVAVKSLNVGFATASEVARSREGDCSEHAVLLAALARANGLPARAVSGVIYVEGGGRRGPMFGYHMWTQVHLAGQWVDLDAAQHQTDCDPTHIALSIMPMNDDGLADAALALLNVIGRLRIDVLSVE